MSIKNHITDPSTGKQAALDIVAGEDSALLVATREQKIFDNQVSFFANSDYGIDMNQNALPGGTPEEVHDGIDNVYWTGSAIVGGKTTFSSGDRFHTGTNSIKTDNAAVDNVYQFARGSDLTVSDYISLTIWINVDKDWDAGDSVGIFGWDTGTGTQVGTSVGLEDYFTFNSFDVWHRISIPLADMGLVGGTIDALRVQQVSTAGKAPKYYLDDIQIEERTVIVPLTFTLEPEKGTWLHISAFHVFMADNDYNSDNADGTVPAIPYDAFLGVAALDSGIRYQRVQNGKVKLALTLRQMSHLLRLPGATIDGYGSAADGTDTWVSVNVVFDEPVILKRENNDRLEFVVSDDLSRLDALNISAHAKVEYRPAGQYVPPS